MSPGSLDPQWTDRAPSMRVLDPLGAESTEGRLQYRLLRPVRSNAFVQRLRYLSYWAWVTSHLESVTDDDRALYEKVLLLGSLAADCPSAGTGRNGIMALDAEIEQQLTDPIVKRIDISPASFTITSSDRARFTSYYKGVLYDLLLFENEWTLTPLGQDLAQAYGDSVSFEFSEVEEAIETASLSRALLEKVQKTGCLCRMSDRETEILLNCYWYLMSPSSSYAKLSFDREPDPSLLDLRPYLSIEHEREGEELIEATLDESAESGDVEVNEDMERLFATGRDAFVRSSLVLLLATGDWVVRRPTESPDFAALTDAREAWRLLVHTQHASAAVQSLFAAVQGIIRELEPISPSTLLTTVFGNEEFDAVAGKAMAGLELAEQPSTTRSTLTSIGDAVYFGTAPIGKLEVSLPTAEPPISGRWDDVCRQLKAGEGDREDGPFVLTERSERAYRALLDTRLGLATTVNAYREIAAISSVLLARISTRYAQYFSREPVEPFVNWFRSAHQNPGPITIWRLSESYDAPAHVTQSAFDGEWPTSEFSKTAARFTNEWVLNQYFKRLYEKIADAGGQSPQYLHFDAEAGLSFNHGMNSGQLYNEGRPNFPTLKWDRLGDIFFELGLIEDNRLSEMVVTDRGRDLVTAFTTGASQ